MGASQPGIQSLPRELLACVVRRLSWRDAQRAGATCRYLHEVVVSNVSGCLLLPVHVLPGPHTAAILLHRLNCLAITADSSDDTPREYANNARACAGLAEQPLCDSPPMPPPGGRTTHFHSAGTRARPKPNDTKYLQNEENGEGLGDDDGNPACRLLCTWLRSIHLDTPFRLTDDGRRPPIAGPSAVVPSTAALATKSQAGLAVATHEAKVCSPDDVMPDIAACPGHLPKNEGPRHGLQLVTGSEADVPAAAAAAIETASRTSASSGGNDSNGAALGPMATAMGVASIAPSLRSLVLLVDISPECGCRLLRMCPGLNHLTCMCLMEGKHCQEAESGYGSRSREGHGTGDGFRSRTGLGVSGNRFGTGAGSRTDEGGGGTGARDGPGFGSGGVPDGPLPGGTWQQQQQRLLRTDAAAAKEGLEEEEGEDGEEEEEQQATASPLYDMSASRWQRRGEEQQQQRPRQQQKQQPLPEDLQDGVTDAGGGPGSGNGEGGGAYHSSDKCSSSGRAVVWVGGVAVAEGDEVSDAEEEEEEEAEVSRRGGEGEPADRSGDEDRQDATTKEGKLAMQHCPQHHDRHHNYSSVIETTTGKGWDLHWQQQRKQGDQHSDSHLRAELFGRLAGLQSLSFACPCCLHALMQHLLLLAQPPAGRTSRAAAAVTNATRGGSHPADAPCVSPPPASCPDPSLSVPPGADPLQQQQQQQELHQQQQQLQQQLQQPPALRLTHLTARLHPTARAVVQRPPIVLPGAASTAAIVAAAAAAAAAHRDAKGILAALSQARQLSGEPLTHGSHLLRSGLPPRGSPAAADIAVAVGTSRSNAYPAAGRTYPPPHEGPRHQQQHAGLHSPPGQPYVPSSFAAAGVLHFRLQLCSLELQGVRLSPSLARATLPSLAVLRRLTLRDVAVSPPHPSGWSWLADCVQLTRLGLMGSCDLIPQRLGLAHPALSGLTALRELRAPAWALPREAAANLAALTQLTLLAAATVSSLPYVVPMALRDVRVLRCACFFGGTPLGGHLAALLPALTELRTLSTTEYDDYGDEGDGDSEEDGDCKGVVGGGGDCTARGRQWRPARQGHRWAAALGGRHWSPAGCPPGVAGGGLSGLRDQIPRRPPSGPPGPTASSARSRVVVAALPLDVHTCVRLHTYGSLRRLSLLGGTAGSLLEVMRPLRGLTSLTLSWSSLPDGEEEEGEGDYQIQSDEQEDESSEDDDNGRGYGDDIAGDCGALHEHLGEWRPGVTWSSGKGSPPSLTAPPPDPCLRPSSSSAKPPSTVPPPPACLRIREAQAGPDADPQHPSRTPCHSCFETAHAENVSCKGVGTPTFRISTSSSSSSDGSSSGSSTIGSSSSSSSSIRASVSWAQRLVQLMPGLIELALEHVKGLEGRRGHEVLEALVGGLSRLSCLRVVGMAGLQAERVGRLVAPTLPQPPQSLLLQGELPPAAAKGTQGAAAVTAVGFGGSGGVPQGALASFANVLGGGAGGEAGRSGVGGSMEIRSGLKRLELEGCSGANEVECQAAVMAAARNVWVELAWKE